MGWINNYERVNGKMLYIVLIKKKKTITLQHLNRCLALISLK